MGLSRLAALHGVATSFSPSADVTVSVPDDTVTAVLAALGVDADTPAEVRRSLAAAESAAASRLLPPTVVVWSGEPLPAALTALPPGALLTRRPRARAPPARPRPCACGCSRRPPRPGTRRRRPPGGPNRPWASTGSTVRTPDHRHATATLVVAPDRVPQPPAAHARLPRPALLAAVRPLLGHGRPRATWPTSPPGRGGPWAAASSRSTRCTPPYRAARPTPPRTAPPRAASPTPSICTSSRSRSTATSPSPAGRPWTTCASRPRPCARPC